MFRSIHSSYRSKMFSEPPISSANASVSPIAFTSISSISSRSISPSSTMSRTRTSTIEPDNYLGPDLTSCSNSNYHQQQQSNRQMRIGKYLLERTIGKGNFAVVKLAIHCDTKQKVAIKIIDKSRLDPADRKKLENEITVMKSLIHPYIIRLYEVMESRNLIYLVTEYADNGELLDLLIREKRLSEAKAREKFRQLVLAVEFIHSKNIVHRDLKAENLLLDSHGNIKVADFGFANIFKPDTKLQTFCGSPPYAAPELYQCLPYSPEKVDVWSLGVLLYVFVCGHLPFDSNNLSELRKRVVSGQFRLPFYISADCGSLISHMLTVDPNRRYTISDIKKHSWLMINDSNLNDIKCQPQTIPNCQITNAILDRAESLGYNRTLILKSVNGNSYDSDAAIWHLLLDQFQKMCQIDNPNIPMEPVSNDDVDNSNSSDLARRSTAPIIFDEKNTELVYSPPNTAESIRPQLDPCDLQRLSQKTLYQQQEPQIRIECPDDDNHDDDVVDHQTSALLHEQYLRLHGIRRHTIGRPELLGHGGPIPALASRVLFAHQSSNIEPSLLTNRLADLQQQQQQQQQHHHHHHHHHFGIFNNQNNNDNNNNYNDNECASHSPPLFHQKTTHSTSYNGLSAHCPNVNTTNDVQDNQQRTNWLSPPVSNNFNMNRRASDSGTHLLQFQQQYGVTASNIFNPLRPMHIQSSWSNRSSRGSITRGAPITPPTFSITPHEAEEDEDDTQKESNDEDAAALSRYLERGKRHTVCEPGLLQSTKTRRSTRETTKERALPSRRASDTNSNFLNSTNRAHLERLYNNAVNPKASDEDLTASSLQELQQLQKQVQKYPTTNSDSSPMRRTSNIPSPTNCAGLQMIQEEHQQNSPSLPNPMYVNQHQPLSPSSSDDASTYVDNHEHVMDWDIQHHQPQPQQQLFALSNYNPSHTSLFFNSSPLRAQHLAIPTTNSSYMP